MQIIVTTSFGLEAVVSRELKALGYEDQTVSDGRIIFEGDAAAICRANLWLRSADRVFLKVASFQATDFGELFDQTFNIQWSDILPQDALFPVRGRSVRSQLHSVPDAQSIVKKAIVKQMQKKYQTEWFEEDGADYAVEFSILKDEVTLAIDTSGTALNRRGYRTLSTTAPLKETLAAALVQLSFWNRERPFVDPFCGSGTIPIEAALIARNIAPGINRVFAADEWGTIDSKEWINAREEAKDSQCDKPDFQLIGTDLNRAAIKAARHHAKEAGVFDDIYFEQKSIAQFSNKRKYGCIFITTDKLFLGNNITLDKGELSANIKDQKINISTLGGHLWEGRLQSKGSLDLSKTLAVMTGEMQISDAQMKHAPFKIDKSPVLEGQISLRASFNGRGLGPSGLFSLLNGTGHIDFSNGRVDHLSSKVLADIVDDELAVWNQAEDQAPFFERFKRHLQHGEFTISSLSENFTIKDGSLLLKATKTSQNHSKLALDASITLASMTSHSRLSISPLAEAKYPNLPPVTILLDGPLNDLQNFTPKIETGSLEQHLKVMKMEHDVNLLEKLHKRDEEFAQKAAERRTETKLRKEQEELEKQAREAESQPEAIENQPQAPPVRKRPFDWNPFGGP